jgi:histidinol-phosphate phosphatase family protein
MLDKDGTLVEDVPYNVDPRHLRLAPGAAEALRLWRAAGFVVLVVTNQSGVARGYFGEGEVRGAERALRAALRRVGADIDGFYFCPHHPEGVVEEFTVACTCRKPLPGLVQRAARDQNVDLAQSWMVGDILDDVEAGRRAGCRTVLLDVGSETEWVPGELRVPDLVAGGLVEAARAILAAGPRRRPQRAGGRTA